MSTITIVGLGPGDIGLLTCAAWELLRATPVLYLRTARHPTVAALPTEIELRAFDAHYEAADDFDALYQHIAADLIARANAGESIVYAVPGHPLIAETTTRHILAQARQAHITTHIVAGVSFIEPVCTALALDPLASGLQLIDALDFIPQREHHAPPTTSSASPTALIDHPTGAWSELHNNGPYVPTLIPFPITPTRPALICQLYSRPIASHVKLSLLERYPADHPITLVRAAGVANEERTWHVPLHELDHQHAIDHLTCAYLPALAPLANLRGPEGITYIVTRLLGPNGCPWDREQTHRTLRPGLLEETHEVLEALDADDSEALAEELGDLLLHILLHSEIARQANEFDLNDVYEQIATKLIRRHPHVFGSITIADSGEVLRNWEAIKRAERAAKGHPPRDALGAAPETLPALAAAQETTRKAAKLTFDWPDIQGVWDKIAEEIAEIHAVADHPTPEQTRQIEDEIGDLLFAVVNLARWLHVDAESALRSAHTKFRRRLTSVIAQAQAHGRDLTDMSADEKDALWEQAKTHEP